VQTCALPISDHIGGQAEPGTPVVVERLAVLLDQVEELEDSPSVIPECSSQPLMIASKRSMVMSSSAARVSSGAISSRIVNVASMSVNLRTRRTSPGLIDLLPGRVYVSPLCSNS